MPAKGHASRIGGNCWSRGWTVRLLLSCAQGECRPSWAPPISMTTVLLAGAHGAIGVKAHCLPPVDRRGWKWRAIPCIATLQPKPAAMLKTCPPRREVGQFGGMTMTLQHVVARSMARGLINGSAAPDLSQAMAVHRLLLVEGDASLAAAVLRFAQSLPPSS